MRDQMDGDVWQTVKNVLYFLKVKNEYVNFFLDENGDVV